MKEILEKCMEELEMYVTQPLVVPDSFLLTKMSMIRSGLVELILSGMWKDVGRH